MKLKIKRFFSGLLEILIEIFPYIIVAGLLILFVILLASGRYNYSTNP